MSNSEHVRTGDSFFGGKYAEDSKGNIGRGSDQQSALIALQAAQGQSNNNGKK